MLKYIVYSGETLLLANVNTSSPSAPPRPQQKEIIEARHTAIEAGRIDKASEPFSIRAKEFWDPSQTNSLLSEKFCRSLGHEPDGLIFQPVNDVSLAPCVGFYWFLLFYSSPTHRCVGADCMGIMSLRVFVIKASGCFGMTLA